MCICVEAHGCVRSDAFGVHKRVSDLLVGVTGSSQLPRVGGCQIGSCKKQNVRLTTKPSSSLETLRLCLVLLDSLLMSSLGQAGPEFPVEPRMTSNL